MAPRTAAPRVLGLLLLLAACGVALLVWLTQRSAVIAEPGSAEIVQRGAPEAEERDLPVAPGGESRLSVDDPAPAVAPPAAHAPAGGPAATPVAMQIVRVVERASGGPIEGAEVRWMHTDELAISRMRTSTAAGTRRLGALIALLERDGDSATTDAQGIARLPRKGGRLALMATAPSLFGFGAVPGDTPGELRVELSPDASVDVEVLDAAGAPAADVPVALRLRTGSPPDDEDPVLTGANGRATLRHVLYPRAGVSELHAGISAPLLEPVQALIDPRALPSRPIRLVLPPTGSLEVVARNRGGQPAGEGNVHVILAPAGQGPAARAGEGSGEARARMQAGRALIPHLAPGLDLRITVQPDASPFSAATVFTAGPMRAHERRTVEVELGSDFPTLRLRVLDEQGLPLADAPLRLMLGPKGRVPFGMQHEARTDATGHLLLDLWSGFPGRGTDPWRLHVLRPGATEASRPALEGVRDLEGNLDPGVHELGDLRLGPATLLAEGLVLDPAEQPLEGATVVAQAWLPDNGGRWTWSGWRVLTDAAGRFALHGDHSGGPFALLVSFPELAQTIVECEPGARDLLVKLPSTATLAGRLLLDPRLPEERITILAELESAGGVPAKALPPSPPKSATRRMRRDGTFAIGELVPGLWTVSVHLMSAGRGIELAKLGGVDLSAGGAVRDPRLDPLDLRGAVTPITIELVPPPDGPPISGYCEWREAGATGNLDRVMPEGGRVRLFAVGAALEVRLSLFGYRLVHLESVSADTRVELRPGPHLRLRLPPGLRLPDAPAAVVGEIFVKSASGADLTSGLLFFDRRGEVGLRACAPGPLRARLRLAPTPTRARSGPLLGPEWHELELQDAAEEQVLVLDLTQAQIDAAAAALQR